MNLPAAMLLKGIPIILMQNKTMPRD